MKTELEHLVFVTNGKDVALWFKGTIGVAGAGVFYLQDQDLHAINAKPQGNNYTGLITVAQGQHVAFTAVPAKGDAGLYRAKEGDAQSGWIVLEDGSVRGAKVAADGKIEGLTARGGVKWTDAKAEP
jgi:streptogramin lyase